MLCYENERRGIVSNDLIFFRVCCAASCVVWLVFYPTPVIK
jgi:hypothetical protein